MATSASTGVRRRRKLTPAIIDGLRPRDVPYREWDSVVPQLYVRVQPSGIKSFNVAWSRHASASLGKHPALLPDTARQKAREVLQDAEKHGTPAIARARSKVKTLRDLVDHEYEPWAAAHQKSGARSAKRVLAAFNDIADKPLREVNSWTIERWRARRLKDGKAPGTVNREVAALKSVLTKAVAWRILDANPLDDVKLRKVDNARVRYLGEHDAAEEGRLRTALAARDAEARRGRVSANAWRAERDYDALPLIPADGYGDHLTPMVLVALNTGLRRGELTALTWDDVNLATRIVTVRAAAAKSSKSRHVPLNVEAVDVLTRWKKQRKDAATVFGVRTVTSAWDSLMAAAKITGFHFHDLRHTFASKLVTAGVDLNTVRELLGHADLKMTLRYAHLAPGRKEAAVELLAVARS
jgi:integrase